MSVWQTKAVYIHLEKSFTLALRVFVEIRFELVYLGERYLWSCSGSYHERGTERERDRETKGKGKTRRRLVNGGREG